MNLQGCNEQIVGDAVKQMQFAIRSIASYPAGHPIADNVIKNSYDSLTHLFNDTPSLTLSNDHKKLLVNEIPIEGNNIGASEFVKDLEQRNIHSITFHHGLSLKDFRMFLAVMTTRTNPSSPENDFAAILRHNGISNIHINKIKYGKLSEEEKRSAGNHTGDYRGDMIHTLEENGVASAATTENDHPGIHNLIEQVTEDADILINSRDGATRATATVESLKRITAERLSGAEIDRTQLTYDISAVLSTFDDKLLTDMTRTMEIREEKPDEIIARMTDELFYGATAEICADGYAQSGTFDRKFIESVFPTPEEQKRVVPYLTPKLAEYGNPDDEEVLRKFLGEESGKDAPFHGTTRHAPGESEIGNEVSDLKRLLSEGKNNEAQDIIKKLSRRLDDTSSEIRQKIADAFFDVTSTLSKFDTLRENYRDISETLINRLNREDNVETYLTLTKNFQTICTSQNRNGDFLATETIGGRLVENGSLSKDQLKHGLMARKKNGKSLQYNLGALNLVDEATLLQSLSQQYKNCRTINFSEISDIQKGILDLIPTKFIKRYTVLPVDFDHGNLCTAMICPENYDVINDLRFITGRAIIPCLAAEYHLLRAIEKSYHIKTDTPELSQVMEDIQREDDLELIEEQKDRTQPDQVQISDAPVVKLVNLILKEAIAQKASDVHIEPFEDEMKVRLRIDGTLTEVLSPSIRYSNGITSRIKIMSGLDISEKRLPQDGRCKIKTDGRCVDIRVSTFPGNFGEKMVLRLLDQSNLEINIEKLGMSSDNLNSLMTAIHKSKGMVLVTGPTGSGKTTTLYSALNVLNDGTRNIVTAEDPIEYNLKGINQFQINSKIGLDFARALRSFLRQDPDIIMVGEIRDFETAEIAVKASLTGHLILSTLHTNSAADTITRLLDMGVESYLITSSVNLIIAQRLMRTICEECKVETSPNDFQLKLLELHGFNFATDKIYRGKGCPLCNHTGYKGRTAIYEFMPMERELQELILRGASSFALREKAMELGRVTLQMQGFDNIIRGVTTADEWMRVTI